MKTTTSKLSYCTLAAGCLALSVSSLLADPGINTNAVYAQTNLVSDISGRALRTDARLINPWGILASAEGTWVANNGTGLIAGYGAQGTHTSFAIHVKNPAGEQGKPDGLVFNDSAQFVITNGHKHGASTFLIATEDGTIAAWNHSFSGSNAVIVVDRSGSNAVYKGLTIIRDTNGAPHIYAADFHNNAVDVFDGSFNHVNSFTDTTLPANFAPFNCAKIHGKLFVSFALQLLPDAEDDQSGPGNGYVDIFDTDGTLLRQFASQGVLNSPWGMVEAPDHFGKFSGALLVGNFGDGRINAFDLITGKSLGPLSDASGNPIANDGQWGLAFNRGPSAARWGFDAERLYFTAGLNGEDDGLLGYIRSVGRQANLWGNNGFGQNGGPGQQGGPGQHGGPGQGGGPAQNGGQGRPAGR
jgi:uncharacterized protein (TIGR03118 family)